MNNATYCKRAIHKIVDCCYCTQAKMHVLERSVYDRLLKQKFHFKVVTTNVFLRYYWYYWDFLFKMNIYRMCLSFLLYLYIERVINDTATIKPAIEDT